MKFVERFREDYPEGRELWCWYSGYDLPHAQASVWLTLDKWALGVDTEVDIGGHWTDAEQRRFFSVYLGPLSLILMRVQRSRYAA